MNETFDYLKTMAAFPPAVRRFAATPRMTLPEAQRIVRERIDQREANFLHLAERAIYGWPRSPYLPLLKQAGCTLGDLRTLVNDKGLDGALVTLREAGVYVAFEEFKGRKPIRRGGLEIPVAWSDFDNPLARRDLIGQTSGSTGAARNVGVDMADFVARAPDQIVTLAAHGVWGVPTALWQGILPATGFRLALSGWAAGILPERWFSPIGLRDSRYWLKYDLATYYLTTMARLAGIRVPYPEYVSMDNALVVARWAAEAAKRHGRSLIRGNISRGTRVGLAAQAAGLDLTGVTITGAGEPPSPAKVDHMTRTGARYFSGYGMSDGGKVGSGCVYPLEPNDQHILTDAMALIPYPHWVEGFGQNVPAFHLTTLLPTAAKLLFNVETDDYGIVEERQCGCELEQCGYTTHLRQIHSYSKLTGEGVTLIGDEMARILEETLPARFGGSPLDYQLMEDEDERGLTRLYLTVHPRVENLDEQAVIVCVLDGLGRSSPMADNARLHWQNAGSLQVRRTEPARTFNGKQPLLYVARRARETQSSK